MARYTEIPENYDELTNKQFLFTVKEMIRFMSGLISFDSLKISVLFHYMNKNLLWFYAKNKFLPGNEKDNRNGQINRLIEHLNWIVEFEEEKIVFPWKGIENKIPVINKLYGSADAFLDFTFGEFRCVLSELRQYKKTREQDNLDKLIAILYRPAVKGKRIDFNKDNIEKYIKKIKQLPYYIKYAILQWVYNCMDNLENGTFIIEGNEVCFYPLFKNPEGEDEEQEEKQNQLGMMPVLYALAETGIYGDMKAVDNANLFDVLTNLLDKYYEKKRIEKENNKNKR